MKRRLFLTSTLAIPFLPRAIDAQRAARVARIGWLTAQQASSLTPFLNALRVGFAHYGYEEGRNLVIEYRYGDDAIERVPELAAELVRLPVDVIMAQGAAVSVISKLGLTVPIVYVFSGDPVSAGFADSLARPRGNMTGLTFMAAEFNGSAWSCYERSFRSCAALPSLPTPSIPASNSSAPTPKAQGDSWA